MSGGTGGSPGSGGMGNGGGLRRSTTPAAVLMADYAIDDATAAGLGLGMGGHHSIKPGLQARRELSTPPSQLRRAAEKGGSLANMYVGQYEGGRM